MIRVCIVACVLALWPLVGMAKVVGRSLEYKVGDKTFEGYLAFDDAKEGKRPGVLVVHEWWGLNDYAKKRANMLAEMGYVAFAADMFGKGVVTDDPKKAGELAGELRGKPAGRLRAFKALNVLASDEHVDPKHLAAIGYCFGGSIVLDMVFAGAGVNGVVSFHGGLMDMDDSAVRAGMKTKVLVLTGADDPMVPLEAISKFETALKRVKADYQIVLYSGAKHSFTNPQADQRGMEGVAYNKAADLRSWAHMKLFFHELFAERGSRP